MGFHRGFLRKRKVLLESSVTYAASSHTGWRGREGSTGSEMEERKMKREERASKGRKGGDEKGEEMKGKCIGISIISLVSGNEANAVLCVRYK